MLGCQAFWSTYYILSFVLVILDKKDLLQGNLLPNHSEPLSKDLLLAMITSYNTIPKLAT